MSTEGIPTPELPGHFLMYVKANVINHLSMITQRAEKARNDPRMKGHHCDFRAALDSIHDLSMVNTKNVRDAYKQYRDHNMIKTEKLETELHCANQKLQAIRELVGEHDRWYFKEIKEILNS